jgi:hypothetical protein
LFVVFTIPVRSEELRAAKTESQFRHVNERIADTAEKVGSNDAVLVCECSDPECGHGIEAPLTDYERVREDGAQFIVAPGHERPEHERVKRARAGYRIVEKVKGLGALARRLDPRANES